MRKLQTNKAEVRELVVDNGDSVTRSDSEAAQVLCDYFQQSFTIEQPADGSLYGEKKRECTDSLSVEFDEITVLRKLQELQTDKSPG